MKNVMMISLITLLGVFSVKAQKKDPLFAKFSHEAICMGTELDGSQLVRAFGSGANREDSKEQAAKAAVNAVIFKGLAKGTEGCRTTPLVNAPNARRKNQKFFNAFFADGGLYMDYVHTDDSARRTRKKNKGEGSEKIFSIIFTVDVQGLQDVLKKHNIIPQDAY